ncbi:MAG: Asp-tRNA(Asn)/Glu-tRNA(Gln) amidotransferase subunit GatC [Gammaproteobacteria bacterium]|nr:Asp-tRNA(Asn)/Glu-tRNA(Gln) amidotransferase subunit GatC [Gammaproteobacteria bacterium]
MALDKSEVEKIAQLARLHVDDSEAEEVAHRISDILELINKMQAVDTENIEPLSHPLDAVQRLRTDEVTESDRRDELQTIAPTSEAGLYLVPKVIE